MTDTTTTDIWEFLERPNPHAPEAQGLYWWGLNFDRGSSPFLVFLDLIGWSEDNYGHRLATRTLTLGYVELSHLGEALKEYALNPQGVTAWVDALMQCEGV
jgi:hypothetical protein